MTGEQEARAALAGATIKKVAVLEEELRFTLSDGRCIALVDGGQACCENRYMVCDDDLTTFCGAVVLDVTVRDAPNALGGSGVHEIQFLAVKTTRGEITASMHNGHNGYYGGFCLCVANR